MVLTIFGYQVRNYQTLMNGYGSLPVDTLHILTGIQENPTMLKKMNIALK